MTRRHTIVVAAVLVLAAVLAGCSALGTGDGGGGADVNTSAYDADTLAQDAQTAWEELDSYTYSMELDITGQTRIGEIEVSMEGNGRTNFTNERSARDMQLKISNATQSISYNVERYRVGDTSYLKFDRRGFWQRQPADETTLSQAGPNQQSALLENAELTIEGAERVNGEDTLVVSAEPTDEALEDVAAASAQQADDSESWTDIESASLTQYIAAEEPHHVLRTELEIGARTAEGQHREMILVISTDDHGEDIRIELPPDLPG